MSEIVFWIDENLPPALARWLSSQQGLRGEHFRDLGFQEMPDREVFLLARQVGAVIVSKDADFDGLVAMLGAPPQIVWVRMGNGHTHVLLDLFAARLVPLLEHVTNGVPSIALEL